MKERPERPSVFFDADVLIAGSASATGASRVLLRLSELGLIDGVSSFQAKAEAERNLLAKLPGALPAFGVLTDAACRWVADPNSNDLSGFEREAEAKDVPILVSAVQAGCRTLVTFNTRHFYPSGERAITVEAPGEFLRHLREAILAAAGGAEAI